VAENFENHGKNSSKFYEIKKKSSKRFPNCFCYRFSDIARWHFIGRLKIEENPKILGFGKKVQVVDINWQK